MSDPIEWAGYQKCQFCGGVGRVFIDDEYVRCPDCEGQGEVCDRCGAPPSYQINEEDWGGGCWCHY
jgi:DnaJ-class molecular chaperone